jgi:hypothetical protein
VQSLGVGLVSVVNRDQEHANRVRTMVEWAREGVEQILLIVLGSYAEIDLLDLVRFHYEGQNRVTRVFDEEGPLGISLLDRGCVLTNREKADQDQCLPSSRYDFLGYVLRLSSTVSYRRLVEDALQGRCEIQPAGVQRRANVWVDETARVHPSAQIEAPCAGRSTVDTPLKKGVANAQFTLSGRARISVACGVVLGNEVSIGGQP